MDEIRAVAGPIVQRYFDKVEEERAASQATADAEAAKKNQQFYNGNQLNFEPRKDEGKDD